MRLVSFRRDGDGPGLGAVRGDAIRVPTVWLERGDEIRIRIDGIGERVHGFG